MHFIRSALVKKSLLLGGISAAALLGLLAVEMGRILLLPRVTSLETVPAIAEQGRQGFLYARIDTTVDTSVSMKVSQSTLVDAPEHVRFFSSGKTENVRVNGQVVVPASPAEKPSAHFERGMNTVEATVRLTDEQPLFSFGLRPTLFNTVSVVFFFAGLVILLLWFSGVRRVCGVTDGWERGILLWGCGLRYLYAFATPYFINSYDFNDHVQYVQFLADHWRMPHVIDMWEGFQMPLYYILITPVFVLARALGFQIHEIGELLTVPSVILSCLTLFFLTYVIRRYSDVSAIASRLCMLVAAFFPGIAYLSGQVSNDTLVTSIGFLWVGALLFAREEPQELRRWLVVAALCGIGMLVKMSAAPWAPVTLVLFVWVALRRSLANPLWTILLFCITVFLAGGWLYAYRTLTDEHFHLIANTSFSSLMQVLPTNLTSLFGFNPLRLLHIPFDAQVTADPFANVYAEDLVRTAHFGTFLFTRDAAIVLVFWMLTTPLLLLGIWHEVHSRRPFLLAICAALLLAGLFMRLRYPYVPCQHFRYIAVLFLPMLLLLKEGLISVERHRYVAMVSHVVVATYALSCAALLLAAGMAS